MELKRDRSIDFLRGIAIIVMILLHTLAHYLSNKTAVFIWDWSNFVVPVFLFVSSYLFFKRYSLVENKVFPLYAKKRFLRLIFPYYLFLVVYLTLVFIIEPKKASSQFIYSSFTLTGGVDINWLVLLFIYLSILNPIILFAYQKVKFLFYLLAAAVLTSTVYLLFHPFSINWKYTMWLPWMLIPIFSLYFVKYEKSLRFIYLSIVALLMIFLLSRLTLNNLNRSLRIFDNKYPPNLYCLSYGLLWTLILYLISKMRMMRIWFLESFIGFFSRYSYSLFFIHYLIIYVATKLVNYWNLHWLNFFILILLSSMLLQYVIKRLNFMIETRRLTSEGN
jgi:peptidoglycan/LPS O-acetylase OafA/YrhL